MLLLIFTIAEVAILSHKIIDFNWLIPLFISVSSKRANSCILSFGSDTSNEEILLNFINLY
jgi:hypothetical protein